MPYVISASRRTDIPAFYSDWFMNRIYTGYCKYQPPAGPIKEVSLKIDDVLAIVFWSRNYKHMIDNGYFQLLKEMGYDFYCHFTVVDYPDIFDPNVIDKQEAKKQIEFLSTMFGKNTVIWRYDPVIFSKITDIKERIDTFRELLELFGEYINRCVISFIDLYKKTVRNMVKCGIECNDPLDSYEDVKEFMKIICDIAKMYDVEIVTCCEKLIREDTELNVEKGHCIDKEILKQIVKNDKKKQIISELQVDKGQRIKFDCGCYKSVDIGRYDTCVHGCIYCYANINKEVAIRNYKKHNPYGDIL